MAFTTYTELKAAIATRLHRTDLTTNIVDYITIAEKRLNRLLKLTNSETEATLTATPSSRSLTLPSGFGSPIALYLTTYLPRSELVYRLPTQMQVFSSNGPSTYWTIDGATISTDTPADLAYTYTLRYAAEYDLAATSTNAQLTDYPDTYFYGALIEAANDLQDDAMAQRYERRFIQAVQETLDDTNSKRSLTTLISDILTQPRSSIFEG